MTRFLSRVVVCLALWCAATCHAQTEGNDGGFREVLEIIELGPEVLQLIAADDLTDADWQAIAQLVGRLERHQADLAHWTLSGSELSDQSVGEIFQVSGTVEGVEILSPPDSLPEHLELSKMYRCQVKTGDSRSISLLTTNIPRRWDLSRPLAEPVTVTGVLLDAEKPLLLTTRLKWFPTSGVASGQLLLARFGMDAGLWDEIVQKTTFITPERGREAEAFYQALIALDKVPAKELAHHTVGQIAAAAASAVPKFATAVAERAEHGLSSVVPLFLDPWKHVGELVRIEGTARRAVRVAVDKSDLPDANQPLQDYFELEVFTTDSQNYPLVCCVTNLPASFPTGDAIRAGVRIDGVFFKLWRYRSRKLIDNDGETTTQKQSYTPIILGGTVTWLQQAPAVGSWWGIVVGGIVFMAIIFGLARMVFSQRSNLRERLPDVLPRHFGE